MCEVLRRDSQVAALMTAPQIADAGSASAYDKLLHASALELETSCGTSRTRVRFAVYTKRETKRKEKQVQTKIFSYSLALCPAVGTEPRPSDNIVNTLRTTKAGWGDDVTRQRCYACDRSTFCGCRWKNVANCSLTRVLLLR